MIDGSPVTFDWIDSGVVGHFMDRPGGRPTFVENQHTTEMIGEGFYVVSRVARSMIYSEKYIYDRARFALEQNGVDTATAERVEDDGSGGIFYRWVPLFPPILRKEPSNLLPDGIVYHSPEDVERLRKMLDSQHKMIMELSRRLESRERALRIIRRFFADRKIPDDETRYSASEIKRWERFIFDHVEREVGDASPRIPGERTIDPAKVRSAIELVRRFASRCNPPIECYLTLCDAAELYLESRDT